MSTDWMRFEIVVPESEGRAILSLMASMMFSSARREGMVWRHRDGSTLRWVPTRRPDLESQAELRLLQVQRDRAELNSLLGVPELAITEVGRQRIEELRARLSRTEDETPPPRSASDSGPSS